MSPNKRVFLFSLSFFCIALLFFGIYNLAFKNPASNEISLEKEKTSETTTPKAPLKISTAPIVAISDEAVLSPTLTKNADAIKYYVKNSGRVHQIDLDGNSKRTFSDKELIGLSGAFWSPDKSKIITKFINAGVVKFNTYDYNELKNTPLGDNIGTVAWHNSGNRIFYEYIDPTSRKMTLNISNPDGTSWTKLVDTEFRDLKIAEIPRSSLVSFWNKPDAFFETTLKSIPLVGGEEKTLLKNIFGADYLWNNNGTFALVSHANTKGGTKIQLSLINSNGGEFRNLDLPTFVSKCVWLSDNKTAYCALPGEIPSSAILPNDYDQEKFHTADTFWKIDTTTGEKNRIIDLDKIKSKYDATNLFLNTTESMLFFVNRTDGKIYKINL